MTTQLMVQPSSLMSSGIKMSEFGDIYLFKFTDELQSRFEELLQKKKADALTPEEEAEAVRVPKTGYRQDGSAVYRKGNEYLIVRPDNFGVEKIVT